jgi:hypothetical protein
VPKPQAQLPPAVERLMADSLESIPACAGVNPELLGLGAQATDSSGVLEHQRRRAGLVVLATFFDSMNLYRKQGGLLTLQFLAKYMNDGRLVRVVATDQQKFVPLLLDGDTAKYDLVMDEAPTSPQAKERNWQLIAPLLPAMLQRPDIPPQVYLELLKESPIRTSVIERIEAILTPPEPDPEQQQREQEEEQLRLRAIVANIMKTEMTAQKQEASAELDRAKAQEIGERVELDALGQARETVASMRPDPDKQAELALREREGAAGRAFQAQEGAAGREAAARQALARALPGGSL